MSSHQHIAYDTDTSSSTTEVCQSVLIVVTINYSHRCSSVVSSSISNQSSHSASMRTTVSYYGYQLAIC